MKTTLSLVFALLLAAAGAGCSGSAGTPATNNDTNVVSNDNGGKDAPGVQTGALVTATAPNDISGDFSFNGNLECTGTNKCEAQVEGSITITFTCPNHLFLPKLVVAPTVDTNVAWNQPGDWGLAPNGMYYDEQAQHDVEVKTYVLGQQILLENYGSTIGAISGDKFSWTSEGGSKYIGTVSVDLKTITYHMVKPGGSEFDITLTRIE